MHIQWYYGQAGNKLGPFTALELRALAIAGKILDTDTIWKGGIERGVLATTVKNLYPPVAPLQPGVEIEAILNQPAVLAPIPIVVPPDELTPATSLEQAVEEEAAAVARENKYVPPVAKKPARKSRAMAIQGAKITSQDGTYVQFTKICVKCGYQDPSRSTMPISQGTTRLTFFCRKCRKARAVEIQGLN